MATEAVKHNTMHQTNLLTLLDCVRRHGPVTKGDVQAKTGMSWGTVSTLSAELAEAGAVKEMVLADGGVGRNPTLLDISTQNNLVIGIDINIEGFTVVVIDLKCRVQQKLCQPIRDVRAKQVLEQIVQLVGRVIRDGGYTAGQLLGIGVAMQGSVDALNGISRYAPYFEDWKSIPLRDILEAEFNLPVTVLHDPGCMAMAEQWAGCAQSIDDFLLIRVSSGIGMGLVLNGRLYTGHEGAAGELGHLIVQPGGELCSCGARGCLEMYASVYGIMNRVANEPDAPPAIPDLASCAALARKGLQPYARIFEEAGTYLGHAVSGLVNLVNPKLIVLSGELMQQQELLLPHIRQALAGNQWKYATVRLKVSDLDGGAAIGAAVSYVQRVFEGELSIMQPPEKGDVEQKTSGTRHDRTR